MPPVREAPSVADYLLAVAPALPDSLVPAPALARVVETARRLPPCTVAAFERPLGGGETPVDFSVYVPRAEQAFHVLASGTGRPGMLLAAAREGGPLAEAADHFWLEFDSGSRGGTEANVFFSPAADRVGECVSVVVAALTARPLDKGLALALDRYAAAVAPGRIFQVGVMLARPETGLRLCTSRLGPTQLRRALRAFEWPGDPEILMAAYLPVRHGFPEVSVAVDLGPRGIGRRVGLELPLYVAGSAAQRRAWTSALESLEVAGYCTAEERHALLAWIGRSLPGDGPWPRSLKGVGVVVGWAQPCFVRALHHVKLIVDDDRFVGAKAYFGLVQGWAPQGAG